MLTGNCRRVPEKFLQRHQIFELETLPINIHIVGDEFIWWDGKESKLLPLAGSIEAPNSQTVAAFLEQNPWRYGSVVDFLEEDIDTVLDGDASRCDEVCELLGGPPTKLEIAQAKIRFILGHFKRACKQIFAVSVLQIGYSDRGPRLLRIWLCGHLIFDKILYYGSKE